MLRSEGVRDVHGPVDGFHCEYRALVPNRLPGYVFPTEPSELCLDLGGDFTGEPRRLRYNQRNRHLVVLGLREEVRSHPRRGRAAVGYYQHLARPRYHVYIDDAEHELFGNCDVYVSRADYLVHFRYGLRPVGEGSHRLRPADFINGIDSRYFGRNENGGIYLPARARRNEGQLLHTGHLRGNRGHENRRWVRCLSAGDV